MLDPKNLTNKAMARMYAVNHRDWRDAIKVRELLVRRGHILMTTDLVGRRPTWYSLGEED